MWDLWELCLTACQKMWLQSALKEGTLNYWQGWAESLSVPAKITTKKSLSSLNTLEGSWLRNSGRNMDIGASWPLFMTEKDGCRKFRPAESIFSRSSDPCKQWPTTQGGWPNADYHWWKIVMNHFLWHFKIQVSQLATVCTEALTN